MQRKLSSEKNALSIYERSEEVRDDRNSWLWMKKGYLKKQKEGLIMTAQVQSLQKTWVKQLIFRNAECVEKWMKMLSSHIGSECNEQAQNEYKKLRYDKVVALLHWQWYMT